MMRPGVRIVGNEPAWKLLFPLLLVATCYSPLAAQQSEVGIVCGVVQTGDEKPIGGFWLMLVNPSLGMNYRKDVNPIGQFTFTDIHPGTYVFKISPYSYTVVSPSQIEVQGGQDLDVKVIVARAPGSASGPHMPAPQLEIDPMGQTASISATED